MNARNAKLFSVPITAAITIPLSPNPIIGVTASTEPSPRNLPNRTSILFTGY